MPLTAFFRSFEKSNHPTVSASGSSLEIHNLNFHIKHSRKLIAKTSINVTQVLNLSEKKHFKAVVEIMIGHGTCQNRNPCCPMIQLRKCPIIFIGFSQFWLEQIYTKLTRQPFKSTQPKQVKEILQIHTIFRCLYENKLCYITLKFYSIFMKIDLW